MTSLIGVFVQRVRRFNIYSRSFQVFPRESVTKKWTAVSIVQVVHSTKSNESLGCNMFTRCTLALR